MTNIMITNIHFNIKDDERRKNIEKLLESIKKFKEKNHITSNELNIILGDFNDYAAIDYGQQDFKKLEVEKSVFSGNIGIVGQTLHDNNYVDIFQYIRSKLIDINDVNANKIIPKNTTIYGGRTDYIYIENMDTNIKNHIFGAYKLYTNSSDHSPLILDLKLKEEQHGGNLYKKKYIKYKTKYLNLKTNML